MSGNPFSEPEDSERTTLRPIPGGLRPPPAGDRPPPGSPQTLPRPGESVEDVAMGINPLVDAAAPLLQLLARLRTMLNPPDPGELRERAVRGMRAFEQRVREAGLPLELIRPAHYALCASLDDVVLNTPWGSTGVWDARPLIATFHQDVKGGERFFDVLAQMRQNPGKFLPAVELMYLCLALGFQGRYRLNPRGPAELDRVREETYALIVRQRQRPEPDLSPHWRGVAAPYRGARPGVPVWVTASVALAVLAGLFAFFSLRLGTASDTVFARLVSAPPGQMPQLVRVHPPPPLPPPQLCDLLQPEVAAGHVAVLCNDPRMPIVRIPSGGMFASGSATIETRFVPLLERIGAALKGEKGQVKIIGYTDDQRIHTLRFPSNFTLSVARAEAARTILAPALGDPARVVAEGRGEADPIADNHTQAGREQNRRIEIVLYRPG